MSHKVKCLVGTPVLLEVLQSKTQDFARCYFETNQAKDQTTWCYWTVLNMEDGRISRAMIPNFQDFCFRLDSSDYLVSVARYNRSNPSLLENPIETSRLLFKFINDQIVFDTTTEIHLLEDDDEQDDETKAFWEGRQDLYSDQDDKEDGFSHSSYYDSPQFYSHDPYFPKTEMIPVDDKGKEELC